MLDGKTQSHSTKGMFSILMSSSMIGLWRGLIGLPFQHPFDTIKTNMQAYQTNFLETLKDINKKYGIKGFYSGFSVNSLRVASKQAYRWPLQISLLGFYNNIFGESISRAASGILCGMSMAAIEVGIICPFQRVKVWLMTAHLKEKGIRQFFSVFPIRNLFDGMTPVLWKQMVSWVTFLGATQYLKEVAYRYSGKDRIKQDLDLIEVGMVSIGVALINTFFVMPVDCIKTHYQKFHGIENEGKITFLGMTKKLYRQFGMRGLFKGWETKLIQYNINSFFTVSVFQTLLKEYENLTYEKQSQ